MQIGEKGRNSELLIQKPKRSRVDMKDYFE